MRIRDAANQKSLPCPPLLLLLLAFVACQDRWAEPHTSGTAMTPDRPECPVVWGNIPMYGTAKADVRDGAAAGTFQVPASGLAVPGPITNIPEFHDCQKFVGDDGNYQALFAIFASNRLDSIVDLLNLTRMQWSSSSPTVATIDSATGVVAAVGAGVTIIRARSVVDTALKDSISLMVSAAHGVGTLGTFALGDTSAPHPTLLIGQSMSLSASLGQPTASILPIGQIYTYGRGYTPLGIEENFSCLYLFNDASNRLVAMVAPEPNTVSTANTCSVAVNPSATRGKILTVVRTSGNPTADYPPVAKWDYDTVNLQYHIGIKCGNAWCDIGSNGPGASHRFTPSPVIPVRPSDPPDQRRVVSIKGWYDRQNLAMTDASGNAIPSGIIGTVVPLPELSKKVKSDFEDSWVLTNFVAMDVASARPGAIDYYKAKYNFDPAPARLPLERLNRVWQCYGTRVACQVPQAPTGLGCKDTFLGIFSFRVWWVKLEPANNGKAMYRCGIRREHSGLPLASSIVATARWRWVARDETIWVYCVAVGCCETGSDQFSGGWF